MWKHSIKICKWSTKEIRRNTITPSTSPFRDWNTGAGLQHTASLGIIHTKGLPPINAHYLICLGAEAKVILCAVSAVAVVVLKRFTIKLALWGNFLHHCHSIKPYSLKVVAPLPTKDPVTFSLPKSSMSWIWTAHTCYPRTREHSALGIQSQPLLHGEFQNSLDYTMRPCFKTKQITNLTMIPWFAQTKEQATYLMGSLLEIQRK